MKSWAYLCFTFSIAFCLASFPAWAGAPAQTLGAGVEATAAPAATSKPGPFTLVNLRGPGVVQEVGGAPCSGVSCTASAGHCECVTITGTATGAGFGAVSYTAAVTVNDDDITPTGGPGSCFLGSGPMTLSNKSGTNIAVVDITGAFCQYITSTARTVNGNLSYTQEPALAQSGKFSDAFGTGSVQFGWSLDETNAAAVNLSGTIQLKH